MHTRPIVAIFALTDHKPTSKRCRRDTLDESSDDDVVKSKRMIYKQDKLYGYSSGSEAADEHAEDDIRSTEKLQAELPVSDDNKYID